MARHRLYDEDDVERQLDKLGVDGPDDTRRAHGSRRHRIAQAGEAERLDLHATGAPNRMVADPVALELALARLRGRRDVLEGLIAEATDLGRGMLDGHGPVAAAVRPAFRNRAHGEHGLRMAMRRYRAELDDVITVIEQTLRAYRGSDLDAAARLNAAGGSGA